MKNILVVLAHPNLHKSRVNAKMLEAINAVNGVTLHDLYEIYPDYHIDVMREQDLIAAHDHIIFQHPFYWYSCPSLLKEWMDLTLTLGWAYGPNSRALIGKTLTSAITAGGPVTSYMNTGYNTYTIEQFLTPFDQTAKLCGMKYLQPYFFYNSRRATDIEIAKHAKGYEKMLRDLRANILPPPFELVKPAVAEGSA